MELIKESEGYCNYKFCSFPECPHTCDECINGIKKNLDILRLAIEDCERRIGSHIALEGSSKEDEYVKKQCSLIKKFSEEFLIRSQELEEIFKRIEKEKEEEEECKKMPIGNSGGYAE